MIYRNTHSKLVHKLYRLQREHNAHVEILKYTRGQFWDEYCGIEPEMFEKLYNEAITDCRNRIKDVVIQIKEVKKQIKNYQRYGMVSSK